MDETSKRMFETYEAWKVTRKIVDELMEEARQGVPVYDDLNAAIERMRESWSEFERTSAPRLRHGQP